MSPISLTHILCGPLYEERLRHSDACQVKGFQPPVKTNVGSTLRKLGWSTPGRYSVLSAVSLRFAWRIWFSVWNCADPLIAVFILIQIRFPVFETRTQRGCTEINTLCLEQRGLQLHDCQVSERQVLYMVEDTREMKIIKCAHCQAALERKWDQWQPKRSIWKIIQCGFKNMVTNNNIDDLSQYGDWSPYHFKGRIIREGPPYFPRKYNWLWLF